MSHILLFIVHLYAGLFCVPPSPLLPSGFACTVLVLENILLPALIPICVVSPTLPLDVSSGLTSGCKESLPGCPPAHSEFHVLFFPGTFFQFACPTSLEVLGDHVFIYHCVPRPYGRLSIHIWWVNKREFCGQLSCTEREVAVALEGKVACCLMCKEGGWKLIYECLKIKIHLKFCWRLLATVAFVWGK